MCGRFYIEEAEEIIEIREIITALQRKLSETPQHVQVRTAGEVFPMDTVPMLINDGEGITADIVQWGFTKFDGKGVLINARSETAHMKPLFKNSLFYRRCLIPATGFFEWKHTGNRKKEKYLFYLPGNEVLYLAGIYNEENTDNGSKKLRMAILTKEANESVHDIHSRMPVIIGKNDGWLDKDADILSYLREKGPMLARKEIG